MFNRLSFVTSLGGSGFRDQWALTAPSSVLWILIRSFNKENDILQPMTNGPGYSPNLVLIFGMCDIEGHFYIGH